MSFYNKPSNLLNTNNNRLATNQTLNYGNSNIYYTSPQNTSVQGQIARDTLALKRGNGGNQNRIVGGNWNNNNGREIDAFFDQLERENNCYMTATQAQNVLLTLQNRYGRCFSNGKLVEYFGRIVFNPAGKLCIRDFRNAFNRGEFSGSVSAGGPNSQIGQYFDTRILNQNISRSVNPVDCIPYPISRRQVLEEDCLVSSNRPQPTTTTTTTNEIRLPYAETNQIDLRQLEAVGGKITIYAPANVNNFILGCCQENDNGNRLVPPSRPTGVNTDTDWNANKRPDDWNNRRPDDWNNRRRPDVTTNVSNNNEINAFFQQLDKNHNGVLTYKEAHDALLSLSQRFGKPYSEKDLKAFFVKVDLNHDKKLSIQEFQQAWVRGEFNGTAKEIGDNRPVSANEIDVFFEQLDKNHNGFLTYKEAHDTLLRLSNRDGKPYSEKDLKAYFARLDLDHDKKLSIREFKDAYISGQFGGNNYVPQQPQQRPAPTLINGPGVIVPSVSVDVNVNSGQQQQTRQPLSVGEVFANASSLKSDTNANQSRPSYSVGEVFANRSPLNEVSRVPAANRTDPNSEIYAFFQQLDKNHNGVLTYKEAHDALLSLSQRFGKPYSEKDLKAFFTKLDLNHDKKLSIPEFKSAYFRGEFNGTAKQIGDNRPVSANEIDIFFEQLDKNHNGFLTYKEAHDTLLQLSKRDGKPYSEKDLKAYFDRLDLDHDKKLSIREFKESYIRGEFSGNYVQPQPRPTPTYTNGGDDRIIPAITGATSNNPDVDAIFFKYDKDRSGFISASEAKALLTELNSRLGRNYGDDELQAFFDKLDINRDGRLSLDEFRQAFNKTGSVAHPASNGNQREIDEIFFKYDKDRSGFISEVEAKALLTELNGRLGRNYGDAELQAFFNKLDINRDGKLSLDEFRQAFNKTGSVARPASNGNQREIDEIFAEYDTDRSGFISVSEAEALLLKLNARLGRSYGEDELKVFFNRLDVNRDGKLSIVEFRRAYENL